VRHAARQAAERVEFLRLPELLLERLLVGDVDAEILEELFTIRGDKPYE